MNVASPECNGLPIRWWKDKASADARLPKKTKSWEAEATPRGQRVVVRGRGVPLEDKFDLNDGREHPTAELQRGRKEESCESKRGTTRRKREEERLTRQREQGEEDKKLAKRENKRARKDEQGGERAKRRSVHTPDFPFYASLEKDSRGEPPFLPLHITPSVAHLPTFSSDLRH